MSCNDGSLSTIRPPVTPADCGCECDLNDLAYTGASSECTGVIPNEKLDSVLDKILTKICELDAEITLTNITWCTPNDTPPAVDASLETAIQFISDNLIPATGNSCDCPVTDDIFFSDTKGIYQCADQDGGYVVFSGNYTNINANTQTRVESDLKVTNGFGAGYTEISTNVTLSGLATDALNYSYGMDANAANITLTLSEIASATLDHKTRRFNIRRLDCNTSFTATIQAFAGETIEGAASIILPIGHSYIIQADDSSNDWVITAEYFGCDTLEAQGNGNIYMAYDLGIGDSTPDAKIDVVNADTTKVTAILENTGVASADLLRVNINGSTKDVIDELGNFQAGGSNPAARIHSTGVDDLTTSFSLLAEGLAGTDFFWVANAGETVIRPAVNKRFSFKTDGSLSIVDDSGIIRDITITSATITWSYSTHKTANTNLNPQATTTAAYWTITPTGTGSTGTNPLMLFDVAPTFNLTGTATGNTYGFRYRPTYTSSLGVDYGVIVESANPYNGFGTSAPTSTLQTGGSFATKTHTLLANTTLDKTHHTILADATAGAFTVTLPAANIATGRIYIIKKIDAGVNVVTIGATVDGGSKTLSNQYAFYTVQSDGSAWYVIGNN